MDLGSEIGPEGFSGAAEAALRIHARVLRRHPPRVGEEPKAAARAPLRTSSHPLAGRGACGDVDALGLGVREAREREGKNTVEWGIVSGPVIAYAGSSPLL